MKPYSTGGQRSSTGAYACRDSSAKNASAALLSLRLGLYLVTPSTAHDCDRPTLDLSVPRDVGGSEVAFTYIGTFHAIRTPRMYDVRMWT